MGFYSFYDITHFPNYELLEIYSQVDKEHGLTKLPDSLMK